MEKIEVKKGFAMIELQEEKNNLSEVNKLIQNAYYCIIWSGSKQYDHVVNDKKISLLPNHFLYLSPEVNHVVVSQNQETDAYLIAFENDFYSRSISTIHQLESSGLFSFCHPNMLENKVATVEEFKKYYIHTFSNAFQNEWKEKLVVNMLERIILNGYMAINTEPATTYLDDDYDVELVEGFKKLMKVHIKNIRHASYYADLLFVTKRRLNKATQKIYNKTAKEILIDEVLKIAKALLINTRKTIKEISIELNFPQETNFTAFFKKHVGISPSHYRQSLHN